MGLPPISPSLRSHRLLHREKWKEKGGATSCRLERERDISERFYFCINKSVREKKNARIEIAKCIDDNNNNNDRIKNGDEKLEKRNGGGGEGREGENAFGYDNNRLTL